ncbi:hypothetical protein [Methylobacterium thuringiense]|uniref:Uncharacterized protein n=1 Tax=Methylobacterium thuringiense TaxID=1003091 RepID=A0ABQ4TSV4_9HYPH|nr:hypothetical protein [Methylobacterium thuringiense]GJE57747.1 hypothetical protein EKPJFOCH_4265 [Methylobacterium thuringiense]
MTNRVIAVATAALLLAGVSAGSAFARGPESVVLPTIEQFAPASSYNAQTTGPLGGVDGPLYDRCVGDSASEGNANQQNFPVKQYGQTSGGTRC